MYHINSKSNEHDEVTKNRSSFFDDHIWFSIWAIISANQNNRKFNLIHHLISRQLKPKTKDFFNKISKNTKYMTQVDASDLQGEKE